MTLDEFRAKYRLQKRLTQRGVASYQALDSSGRVVMVHSLDSAPREEVDHVRTLVHRLDAVDRTKILEILDVDGAPVLVTEYLQGFQTFAQWLEIRTRSTPTAPTAPAEPNRPPRGEFTQLFGRAEVPKTPVLERAAARSPTNGASTACSRRWRLYATLWIRVLRRPRARGQRLSQAAPPGTRDLRPR